MIADGLLGVFAQRELDLFRGVKVGQAVLHNRFGNFVAGDRRHGVRRHRPVGAQRDVGRTCANVAQRQVELAQCLRNDGIHRRNRLEGQPRDAQADVLHRRVQAVDDLARQKGRNERHRRLPSAVVEQVDKVVAVEAVAAHGMSHAKKDMVTFLPMHELLIGLLHRLALEQGNGRLVDGALGLQRHRMGDFDRLQHPSCRGDVDAVQALPDLALDVLFDKPRHAGGLGDVFNLSVDNGAHTMGLLFGRQYAKEPVVLGVSCDTDDAARANVECKNQGFVGMLHLPVPFLSIVYFLRPRLPPLPLLPYTAPR